MRQVVLYESFERFVARRFGDRGRAWLDTLLPVIEPYASEWDLTVENFLPEGLTSCCVTARDREQRPVVLKINGPWTSTAREAAALRHRSPRWAPELLMADETCGVLLLERVIPVAMWEPCCEWGASRICVNVSWPGRSSRPGLRGDGQR